jgi:hypothetical protein
MSNTERKTSVCRLTSSVTRHITQRLHASSRITPRRACITRCMPALARYSYTRDWNRYGWAGDRAHLSFLDNRAKLCLIKRVDQIGRQTYRKDLPMRTVETKTLTAVVKNGVVHISKPNDKRIFAKVRITTNTAKSSKKIEAIMAAFKAYPNFTSVLDEIQKVEPNAYLTLKGGRA